METKAIVGLIDACVSDFDSDGLSDLVIQLTKELPTLLRALDKEVFELLAQSARLIAFSRRPQPLPQCIAILLDIAGAHLPRGRSKDAIPLIERAMDLAIDNNLKSALRRACNIYSLISTDAGIPARGVEYALRSAVLAKELNDDVGVAAAFSNMTAALVAMGMYRETISVALRIIRRFKDHEKCANFVNIARTNMANAALAIQHYSLSAAVAKEACDSMGLPRDTQSLLNRMTSENIWLKSAIGLKDDATVQARMTMIRGLSDAFKSPRMKLNQALAEAAYETYMGDLTIAITKLLELLKNSTIVPALYKDNLVLLVRAYEKRNDHTGALLYLGQLVEFLGKSQINAVYNALEAIRERVQTPMPGKDDARMIIRAIQRTPSSRRDEIEIPESLYREAYERLAVTAELREDTQGRHTYRVGKLASLLAQALGYGQIFCDAIEQAARLHDIGKLGLPDGLLTKPAKLSKAEYTVMQQHTIIGAKILEQCTHPAFRLAEQIALSHHEKWDGSGYPNQLKGENIPDTARITIIADVYDALTNSRPYKRAWTHQEAITEITRNSGSYFEPRIVAVFLEMIQRLRHEYRDDLEQYLAAAGDNSSFIQARDEMHRMLNEMEPLADDDLL